MGHLKKCHHSCKHIECKTYFDPLPNLSNLPRCNHAHTRKSNQKNLEKYLIRILGNHYLKRDAKVYLIVVMNGNLNKSANNKTTKVIRYQIPLIHLK
ncbi:hypothetical protein HanRHA438_Chr15g0728641 [Helianthus annuus]|nr:hypothetical protein HanRHA438_Chr15g0728641 [Helianthus annuus]